MDVRFFTPANADAWDAFVANHPQGTVFHRLAWSRAVEMAYPHEPLHLLASDNGQITGVLPLFFVRSVFVGRVLVSVPYGTYGGILAANPQAAQALLAEAERLREEYRCEYLELRHRHANGLDLPVLDRYDTFRKELPDDPDEVLASLPKKARAATRKGLKTLTTDTGPQYLRTIYDLYAFTLRRLGSPNYRRRLFEALLCEYGDDCLCLVVKDGDKPIAGVVSFVFRDELCAYFSGSLPEAMPLCASNVMYCRLMEETIRLGLRWFDFNRTRRDNHGPHSFKRHNGFEPEPLHYQISLGRAEELPNLSPSNRKFALAGRVWKKLPLWMTRTAGGMITRWIP